MTASDSSPYAWKPPDKDRPLKTVLVAEDEPATQNLCRVGLRGLVDFKVEIVNNGAEALEYLKEGQVHVLVTDLNMPVMDGFNLIAVVGERYPQIPVLVMTSLPESEHQNVPLTLGALRILSKPVRLSMLMEEIKAAAKREPDGFVRGIGLNSLLQLMAWESKQATLVVRTAKELGYLYVNGGELIHAESHDLQGLEAAYAILTWDKPQVEFVDVCRVERTILVPLTEVLMNAAFLRDTTLHVRETMRLPKP